jgi:GNAT superfamily N-acetyltransferase
MEQDIDVRRPTESELSDVLGLRFRVLDEPLGIPRKTVIGRHDQDPKAVHMAAFVGDTIVSTVRFDMVNEGSYLVRRMATDPEYRGNGIGSLVMEAAEAAVIERGARTIVLHARKRAVPFYERLGYVLTGAVEIYNGDENPEMIKHL